jgi:RNA polymerase sporulation-specific sigma factor
MGDDEVLVYARSGDKAAVELLINRYRFLVESKARCFYVLGGDREDVIQEGMIGLYKAIRDYRKERLAHFRSFAEICVTRQIISAIKRASRNKHMPLNQCIPILSANSEDDPISILAEHLPCSQSTDPERCFLQKNDQNTFQYQLQNMLTQLEKDVLRCYLAGMTYMEMAKELHCCRKSVDNALQRVKRKVIYIWSKQL